MMRSAVIKADDNSAGRTIKACGIGIAFLSIVVAGVITLSIIQKRSTQYSLRTMLVMAAYTFYLIIHSIIECIRANKSRNYKIATLRNISLVSAVGAVLSLERSMLGTFGNIEDSFTLIMEAMSGFAAFVLIALIGLETFLSKK